MDKIQMIRKEYEKKRDYHASISTAYYMGRRDEDCDILSFIDSIQNNHIEDAIIDFIDAVSRYVEPRKGDVYCGRNEVLRKRDKLKALLK